MRITQKNNEPFMELVKGAVKFQEDGLWGFKTSTGEILLGADYDKLEICSDFVYAHYGTRCRFYYNNFITDCDDDEDGMLFYENGKVGLLNSDGSVFLEAEYDEIADWGDRCDVVYVRVGEEFHYINHNKEEILTDHTQLADDAYPKKPYSIGEVQNKNVLICVEPIKELTGNTDCIAYGQPVRLSRILYKDIPSIFAECNVVPMPAEALELFMDKDTYIYSARRCRSRKGAADCVRQLKTLGCYDTSWTYLVKISTNSNTKLSLQDLYEVIQHFENLDLCIDFQISVAQNDLLSDGEVELFQVHYFWDDMGAFLSDSFKQEALSGLVNDVKRAIEAMDEEERKMQLRDAYEFIEYNEERTWQETKQVLEYLKSLGCNNFNKLVSGNFCINPYWIEEVTKGVWKFKKNIIQWAIDNGANINRIKERQTLLDCFESSLKRVEELKYDDPEQVKEFMEDAKAFSHWVKSKGAASFEETRKELSDNLNQLDILGLLKEYNHYSNEEKQKLKTFIRL